MTEHDGAKSKIIVVNEYPPIPIRDFDWCAYHDGDEECPWRHGWGATREAALADLARLDDEAAEAGS
jgi:hypothetical protein